ncbi:MULTISPECIES: hypothetical protein [Klebsiella]|uniref:hypothetical protein n=1 Tax=Klebsiella pneumoniae complex TaxID=3390273 RepID=UPI001C82520E|nr:hypothetical protein [Klebsiella pneumoniae]HBQ1940503.1 hypothetical protein [Klebsiella pneumoniae]HBU0323528.1 hypothetical protein [Klebsiella pneumoniae]
MSSASCLGYFFQAGTTEPKVKNVANPLRTERVLAVAVEESGPIRYAALNTEKPNVTRSGGMEPNSPLTVKTAAIFCGSSLLIIASALWAAYTQVQGQVTETRNEISSLRTLTHDDFNRVSDKLDDMNKTLTSIQVDLATQKTKYEKTQQ